MSQEVIPEGIYEHYKGKKYRVIGVAYATESKEAMVLYQAMYAVEGLDAYGQTPIFTRPYENFTRTVLVDGKEVLRFKLSS